MDLPITIVSSSELFSDFIERWINLVCRSCLIRRTPADAAEANLLRVGLGSRRGAFLSQVALINLDKAYLHTGLVACDTI